MVTTPKHLAAAPVLPHHEAPASWTRTARAKLEKRLAALGTTIGELSDARELLGFDRLSAASDADRAEAHHNVEDPAVQAALATVRSCRAWLVAQLAALDPATIETAKRDLDLRTRRREPKATSALRLGELSALLGWALERAEPPRRYGCTVHTFPAHE